MRPFNQASAFSRPVLAFPAPCPDSTWRDSNVSFLPPLSLLFLPRHRVSVGKSRLPSRCRHLQEQNAREWGSRERIRDISFLIHRLVTLCRNWENSFELGNPEAKPPRTEQACGRQESWLIMFTQKWLHIGKLKKTHTQNQNKTVLTAGCPLSQHTPDSSGRDEPQ